MHGDIVAGVGEEMANANARLIASAPELLEACKLALGEFKEMGYEPPRYKTELLEQAIAKAEGR
jgi:hypothetical protein